MSLLRAVSKTSASQAAVGRVAARAMATSSSGASYTERQAALGRPVSPHVTIYAFPITALSSITNRVTAVGLSVGFTGGAAFAAIGGDVPSLIYAAQDLIPGFAPISKFLVAFPITYHSLSAVRHVVWDNAPQFINNVDGPKTSYAIYGASVALGLGAALYTIKRPVEEKSE
ncbi:Transmembrane protein, partial [Globisporangium splendens]